MTRLARVSTAAVVIFPDDGMDFPPEAGQHHPALIV